MMEKLEQHEIDKIVKKENKKRGIEKLAAKWGWSKRRTKKFLRYLYKELKKDKEKRVKNNGTNLGQS